MQDLRKVFKQGDVFFSMNHSNWLSKAMSWFMRSQWSHCGLIKECTEQDIYTVETSDKEVWIGRFMEYLKPEYDWEIWRPKGLDPADMPHSIHVAQTLIGTLYGYLQLLGFAVRCALQRIGIPVPNWIRQGVVCCGVIFYAYHGKLKGFDVDPESRHTQDLRDLVDSYQDQWSMVAKKVGGNIWVSDDF